MAGLSIIVHKGKEIAFYDYRKLTEKEMIKVLEDSLDSEASKRNINLVLSDFTGSYVHSAFMNRVKEIAKQSKSKIKKSAVVGDFSESKRILLKVFNIFTGYNTQLFSNIEEAKNWLVD